jgi:Flp pilus assembly protein TadD
VSRTRTTLLGALTLAACVHSGPNPRTLHYIGKDLVATPPADYRAYGAYVQAQLALGSDPPDLPRALELLRVATDHDRHDAHLWTVRGQVELQLGELTEARRSSARALALRPEYVPAQALAASLQQHASGAPQVVQRRP